MKQKLQVILQQQLNVILYLTVQFNKPAKTTGSKSDQQEIKRLKRQLADAQLENSILKDLVKKTVQVWTSENSSLSNTSPEILLRQKY